METSFITNDQVLEKENELFHAIQFRDIEKLEFLLHDDLLFIIPNGETITKEIDLASHRAGEMIVEELEVHYENISIIEDCAVVTLSIDTKGKMLGQDFEGRFRYIRIWKKIENTLKVIGGSCTKL